MLISGFTIAFPPPGLTFAMLEVILTIAFSRFPLATFRKREMVNDGQGVSPQTDASRKHVLLAEDNKNFCFLMRSS
jgi:hypothetical protein